MASFLNKAKAKVEEIADRNQNKGDNPHSSSAGPHSSNLMNKGDPTIDSDRDHRNDPTSRVGGYGNTQTAGQHGTAHGPGGIATSDTYGSTANQPGYDNARSDNYGPHSSNLMNRGDPRVDSDRDHRNDPTSRVGGIGQTQQYGDNYGQAGGPGGISTSDTGYGTHTGGPAHTGHTGHASHPGGLSAAAATGTGLTGAGTGTGTGNTYDNPQSTNAGPHSSNLMNKLDPRHDSDRDHRNDPTSRAGGYGTQGSDYGHTTGVHNATTHPQGAGYGSGATGVYGTGATEGYGTGTTGGYGAGHTGTHGASHTGTHGGNAAGYGDNSYTPGSGTASNTAGLHNSNLLNKLDPRVDSDLDGSKTYGGNQTHR